MDIVFAIVMVLGMVFVAGVVCALPVWLVIKLIRRSRAKCPKCNQRNTKCISRRCIQEGDEMHMRETECQFQCKACGEVWTATVVAPPRKRDDDSWSSDSSSSSDDNDSPSDFGGGESGGGGANRDF